MKKEFGKHLTIILTEMCRRVDVRFEDVNFSKQGDKEWFQKYEWSEEEQDDFKKWLVDYLYKSTEARRELTEIFSKNKRQLTRAAEMFCFSYGWKFKKGKEDEPG